MKRIYLLLCILLLATSAIAQTTPWSTSPTVTPQTRSFSGAKQIRWLLGTSNLYSLDDSLTKYLQKKDSIANNEYVTHGYFNSQNTNNVHINTVGNVSQTMTHSLFSTMDIGNIFGNQTASFHNGSIYLSGVGTTPGPIVFEDGTDHKYDWSVGGTVRQGFIFHNADGGDNTHNFYYRFDNSTGDWNTTNNASGLTYRTLTTRDIPTGGISGKTAVDSAYSKSKRRLGVIYNVTPSTATSSLYSTTGSGTTWTFNSSDVTTTGGDGTAVNHINYKNYWSNATYAEGSLEFISLSSGSGIAKSMYSPTAFASVNCRVNTSTGAVTIEVYRTGTTTVKATAASTLTVNTNDHVVIHYIKNFANYNVVATNTTTGVSVPLNYTDPFTLATVQTAWSAGHPSITHYGGSQKIINDTYTVNNIVGNDILWVGDSIVTGLNSGSSLFSPAVILGANTNDNVNLISGGSNRTQDALYLEQEILLLKPRIVLYSIGVNDFIGSIPTDSTKAHIDAFRQKCTDNGILFVYNSILPVSPTYGGASNATYQAAIIAMNTYEAPLAPLSIDPFTAFLNATTSALDPKYDSGDGIHLSQYGCETYAITDIGTLRNVTNVSGGSHFSSVGWQYSGSFGNTCCGFVVQNTSQTATSQSGIRVKDNSNAVAINMAVASSTSATAPNDLAGAGNFSISTTGQKLFIGSQSASGIVNINAGGVTGASTRIKVTTANTFITTNIKLGDTVAYSSPGLLNLKANTTTTGGINGGINGVVRTTPVATLLEFTNTGIFYTDTVGGVKTRREIIFDTKTQTLPNKTLTSPIINVGSDATGDIYTRNAGVFTRVAIGSTGNVLTVSGGLPIWSSPSGPVIQASANLTGQTTAGNITTFTVGAATSTFNISAYINVTAVATDVIQAQVTYTDENNTAQTISFTTLSTVSNSTYSPVTIRAKNGTVITLKTNLTTGIGSITFDAGGAIIQN